MPVFDYIVSRPNVRFDLGNGTEMVPHGSRLHGAHVESWGGSVADRLVDGGSLTRVPHDAEAEFYGPTEPIVFVKAPEYDPDAVREVAPVAEADVEGEPKDEGETDGGDVSFPRHTGFGRYELSDGSTVQGKDAAIKAQAELEVDADAAEGDE